MATESIITLAGVLVGLLGVAVAFMALTWKRLDVSVKSRQGISQEIRTGDGIERTHTNKLKTETDNRFIESLKETAAFQLYLTQTFATKAEALEAEDRIGKRIDGLETRLVKAIDDKMSAGNPQ